jgi:hypothetical protein
MKQTAVEWISENIDNLIPYMNDNIAKKFSELVQQAKEMEKEQIIDCYAEANTELTNEDGSFITGEQYYNETFKQE